MKTANKKPLFRLIHNRDGEYGKLIIELIDSKGGGLFDRLDLSLRWQSDSRDPKQWYAFKIDVNAESLNDLKRAQSLLRKAIPKDSAGGFSLKPAEVFATLAENGIRQGVYDPRVSEFVAINDLMGEDQWRWIDSPPGQQCNVGAIARDEETARKKIAEKLASQSMESLEKWIADGKYVRQVDGSPQCETVKPADVLPEEPTEAIA